MARIPGRRLRLRDRWNRDCVEGRCPPIRAQQMRIRARTARALLPSLQLNTTRCTGVVSNRGVRGGPTAAARLGRGTDGKALLSEFNRGALRPHRSGTRVKTS